jgi:penicillin-binding protein 2
MIVRYRFRIFILLVLVLGGFSSVIARLYYIQVQRRDYYTAKVPGASEVTVRVPGVRGEIRDRNGITLVENVASYQVLFDLKEILADFKQKLKRKEPGITEVKPYIHKYTSNGYAYEQKEPDMAMIVKQTVLPKLAELGLSRNFNAEELQRHWRDNSGLVPYAYADDLNFAEFSMFAEHSLDLPGVEVAVRPKRHYVYDSLAAHVLGYVREPDIKTVPEEVRKRYSFYVSDDFGVDGIEKTMDAELQGRAGRRTIMKNEKGRIVGQTEFVEPQSGSDVYLTIDARIQYIAERALREANGGKGLGRAAVVVMAVGPGKPDRRQPSTGDVLAMASVPSFNPNKFIPSILPEEWEKYLKNKVNPLMNRALKDYAPGSTFKIPISLAGAYAGVQGRSFNCSGGVSYGNTYMLCWIGAKGGAHGTLGLESAITQSCNSFFYQYGNATGIKNIQHVCHLLGLGAPTGIKLMDESPGIIPGPEYLRLQGRGVWGDAHTANVSIGQGDLEASPLQMASVIATVAGKGLVYVPRIVRQSIENGGEGAVHEDLALPVHNLIEEGIPAEAIDTVRQGMWNVVNGGSGTARRAQSKITVIAGKTGTAQFERNHEPDNHAWFVCFAPFDEPKYSVCVFVEGGKAGGTVAAPIAKRIIEETTAMEQTLAGGVTKPFTVEIQPLPEVEGNFDFTELVSFDGSPIDAFVSTDDGDDGSVVPARQSKPTETVSRKREPKVTLKPDARGTQSSDAPPRRSVLKRIFRRR